MQRFRHKREPHPATARPARITERQQGPDHIDEPLPIHHASAAGSDILRQRIHRPGRCAARHVLADPIPAHTICGRCCRPNREHDPSGSSDMGGDGCLQRIHSHLRPCRRKHHAIRRLWGATSTYAGETSTSRKLAANATVIDGGGALACVAVNNAPIRSALTASLFTTLLATE